ncbi:MAG: hypothetical protein Q8L47_02725 [bacterium]|nr:hypothetical protein [bacterium]
MSHEGIENEANPEKILSREEILLELRNRCENFDVIAEREDKDGIYFLKIKTSNKKIFFVYQRERSLAGEPQGMESARTTIRMEWADDSYAKTLADYNPFADKWVDQ